MKLAKPLFLALFSGLLFTFAWHPYGIPVLLFVAFVPLFLLQDFFLASNTSSQGVKIFLYSFLAFLTWNIGVTWWIYYASGGGAILAFLANALFVAILFFFYHKLFLKNKERAIWLFPLIWTAYEFLHLSWDFSWPWLTLGNALAGIPKCIQWYEYTGVLGGSLWVLFGNVLVYKIISPYVGKESPTIFTQHGIIKNRYFWILILVLLAPVVLSYARYASYSETGESKEVVIVQPNIDPYNTKFTGNPVQQVSRMLALASTEVDSNTAFLVFPETAIPNEVEENNVFSDSSMALMRIYARTHPNLTLVFGASTYRIFNEGEKRSSASRNFDDGAGFYESYNTAVQMIHDEAPVLYHKSRLVPGVEKIPYPQVFGLFEKFAIDMGGTTGTLGVQDDRTNFSSKNGVVAPVICYESIYGDFLSGFIRNGAQVFAIITNDGWWEDTPGYRQHLALGRMRAIEFRRDIARSANTGISCFVNQRGDILQPQPYWVESVIKGKVNLNTHMTLYAQLGDWPGWLCSGFVVLLVFSEIIRKRFRQS